MEKIVSRAGGFVARGECADGTSVQLCGASRVPGPCVFASSLVFCRQSLTGSNAVEGAFTGNVGHVIFMPGFHACGTLLVLSAEGLTFDDLALLPNDDEQSVAARFASAANSEQEQDAREDQIVTWAKGWRKTCGKGESNKEVRVAKVSVDALKKSKDAETRAAAMNELG